jgi:TRAP-type C4-dicarboxylate transport system permease small subunit
MEQPVSTRSSRLDSIYGFFGRLSGGLIYLSAGAIAIDVVARLAEMPVRWSFEVYPWLAYWSALIGAGYVTYLNGNVRMDLLVEENWLGPFTRIQPWFADAVSLAFLAAMIWAGSLLTINLWESGKVTYELRTPLFYHSMAIPVGFALAAAAVIALMFTRRSKRASKGIVE